MIMSNHINGCICFHLPEITQVNIKLYPNVAPSAIEYVNGIIITQNIAGNNSSYLSKLRSIKKFNWSLNYTR